MLRDLYGKKMQEETKDALQKLSESLLKVEREIMTILESDSGIPDPLETELENLAFDLGEIRLKTLYYV